MEHFTKLMRGSHGKVPKIKTQKLKLNKLWTASPFSSTTKLHN